jgi:2,4-dienoyl-CoA reductase (NADPH2)
VNAPKNPLGCYEEIRFPSREAMIDEIMSVYQPRPAMRVPLPQEL